MFVAQVRPVAGSTQSPTAFRRPVMYDAARAALRRDDADGRASRIGLQADVAARPGRQEQAAVGEDRHRPCRVAPGRQALEDDRPRPLAQVRAELEPEEPGLPGHEQSVLGLERDGVGALEPSPDLDDLVDTAVAVTVREGDDALGTRIGKEQRAIRCHRHEPRRRQAIGEDRGGIAIRHGELRPAAGPTSTSTPSTRWIGLRRTTIARTTPTTATSANRPRLRMRRMSRSRCGPFFSGVMVLAED